MVVVSGDGNNDNSNRRKKTVPRKSARRHRRTQPHRSRPNSNDSSAAAKARPGATPDGEELAVVGLLAREQRDAVLATVRRWAVKVHAQVLLGPNH